MKQPTLRERIASLEAVVEERTKTIFEDLKEIKSTIHHIDNNITNHLSQLEERVARLESRSTRELTRREKIKVYGSIASALIMAVASIVVQLLR